MNTTNPFVYNVLKMINQVGIDFPGSCADAAAKWLDYYHRDLDISNNPIKIDLRYLRLIYKDSWIEEEEYHQLVAASKFFRNEWLASLLINPCRYLTFEHKFFHSEEECPVNATGKFIILEREEYEIYRTQFFKAA